MSSISERSPNDQTRTYDRASSVVFLKTHEPFGGLSNMAGGFPLDVQGIRIFTSEALYQACRFPHLPEVQRLIIGQASPMTAKMKGKPHRKDSRPDWDRVRVKVMRWCLRVKLAQNWAKFSELLLRTGARPIVEESRKDDFWGAKPMDEQTLVGMNVLGRLLMELRQGAKEQGRGGFRTVEPLAIPEFLLFGRPIGTVGVHGPAAQDAKSATAASGPGLRPIEEPLEQASLFDARAVREAPAPACIADSAPESARLDDLTPYPAMKASGVSWLGGVPEHWQVLPNRTVFTEVKERDHPDADMLSVTITKGVIRQRALLDDSSKKDSSNQDKSAYKLVRPGDIAYNKMRAWQGAVGVSEYEGIVSPAYVVQRPREDAAPRYMHYLLRTPAFAKEAERWSYGITSDMWSLRPEHFKMIYSCLPPLPEQVAIVRFLDHADRRIRRYICAKQKLVELLEEQKRSIIRRVVTRGLDPDVRLKPSGVEWLGDVPERWDVLPLKRLARFKSGAGFPVSEQGGQGFEIPFLRVSDMNRQGNETWIESADSTVAMETALRLGAYVFPVGSIIFPKVGGALLTNKRRLLRTASCIDNNVMGCVVHGADRDFLFLLLQQLDLGRLAKPGPVPAVGEGDVREIRVAVPSATEQSLIVHAERAGTAGLIAAISSAHREVILLREYRTRLIADVVTGKLDVREVAARLPEEADEAEPFDESVAEAEGAEAAVDDADEVTEETEA